MEAYGYIYIGLLSLVLLSIIFLLLAITARRVKAYGHKFLRAVKVANTTNLFALLLAGVLSQVLFRPTDFADFIFMSVPSFVGIIISIFSWFLLAGGGNGGHGDVAQ